MAPPRDYADEETTRVPPTVAPLGHRLSPRPQFVWTDARGSQRAVVASRVRVGSSASADLVVHDPTVSRLHAELDVRDDGVWVRDLGSRNGTFVDTTRVREACVPAGGRLRLGAAVLTLEARLEPTEVEQWPSDAFGPLVGSSAAMRELFARLARYAATDSTVLIQGETGTGKELVARALHEASARAAGPLVVVDCAALPDTLLESELFGHAKGSFTGATGARVGAIESAAGGTVFLDEIGELPLAMQPKLLRAIESRSVRRVGETNYRAVDVRFVSATHRDLASMVNAGAFREDLYFRLAVLPVTIPPLRARLEDARALVDHFLPASARAMADELLAEVPGQPWLGNVRELRNFVERAVAIGPRAARDASPSRAPVVVNAPPGGEGAIQLPPIDLAPFRDVKDRFNDALERAYFGALLARFDGNVAAASQYAGLDRTHVYRVLRKLRGVL